MLSAGLLFKVLFGFQRISSLPFREDLRAQQIKFPPTEALVKEGGPFFRN
jgi:hypothetical protein